jgi:hypothetical protein
MSKTDLKPPTCEAAKALSRTVEPRTRRTCEVLKQIRTVSVFWDVTPYGLVDRTNIAFFLPRITEWNYVAVNTSVYSYSLL